MLNDLMMIENGVDHDDDDGLTQALAMQRVINDGAGWCMQGSMGRAMMRAIDEGLNMLGPNRSRDYYGNTIPARTDVQAGTKGSRELVASRMGEEWAAAMEAA